MKGHEGFIGRRSAERIALYILEAPQDKVKTLSQFISQAKENIKPCSICNNFSTDELCPICKNAQREKSIVCIVEYPKDVFFSVFGEEKVENFLKFNKVGQTVDVSFNVESREYNDRFYTDLQAWKVFTNAGGSEAAKTEAPKEEFHKADDLPF